MPEDYLSKPTGYQLRKLARYARLYGPRRTFAKVRAQLHMRRTERFEGSTWRNPRCRTPDRDGRAVAIVGCGNFSHSTIAYFLSRYDRRFLRATHDVEPARARSLCVDYGGAYATIDLEEIFHDPHVTLVFIASNHASHADYAAACLDAGKDVHVEKPQAVTRAQLERLVEAQRRNPERLLFLGYNRTRSSHFERIRSLLRAQAGPTMINWFIAGHRIPPDHWYFSPEEGGRILSNICHWTDLSLALVGADQAFPCEVVSAGSSDSPSDFCFGIRFADGSVAGLTFSAKGHTFEGVREVLNLHRGDLLLSLSDFHRGRVDVGARRERLRTLFRDHGHATNVLNSIQASASRDTRRSVNPSYNFATGALVLGVQEAVEREGRVLVESPPL